MNFKDLETKIENLRALANQLEDFACLLEQYNEDPSSSLEEEINDYIEELDFDNPTYHELKRIQNGYTSN